MRNGKTVAVHEVGTYKTDCDCTKHHFRKFGEAVVHARACGNARHVYFCGHYEQPRIVWSKDGGAV